MVPRLREKVPAALLRERLDRGREARGLEHRDDGIPNLSNIGPCSRPQAVENRVPAAEYRRHL
jgi:hypothetical protein